MCATYEAFHGFEARLLSTGPHGSSCGRQLEQWQTLLQRVTSSTLLARPYLWALSSTGMPRFGTRSSILSAMEVCGGSRFRHSFACPSYSAFGSSSVRAAPCASRSSQCVSPFHITLLTLCRQISIARFVPFMAFHSREHTFTAFCVSLAGRTTSWTGEKSKSGASPTRS